MKTIFIWDELDAEIKFFVLPGNYSHFNRVYLNGLDKPETVQKELSNLVYCENTGEIKHTVLKEFPIEEVDTDTVVIVAGFIP